MIRHHVWLMLWKKFNGKRKMFGFGKKNSQLLKLLPEVKGNYESFVPMSKYTWFGVGGPAEVMYHPEDDEDLCWFLKNKPYNLPLFVVGGGSNLLVRDGGIPGVVIRLDKSFYRKCSVQGETIVCGAGFKNKDLKKVMIDNEIGGLEFLVSIPGTLGGAVRSNAGCFGKELKDVLVSAVVVDSSGKLSEVVADDFNLAYRSSTFPEDWIVTSLCLKVNRQSQKQTADIIEEQKNYRLKHQPHNVRTAGSTFKNPEGLAAWKLIKETKSNLITVNGAKVSDVHCNFLINDGNASVD